MRTIVVVNGAYDWTPHFIGERVVQVQVQRSRWLLERGALWIIDSQGTHRPDAILWRLGAVSPSPKHRACLELIRLAKLPCVNPAATLLRGYDRLGMLAELREAGLPVIDFDVFLGCEDALEQLEPPLPAVIKVGNLHGGLGKALAHDTAQWRELTTLAALASSAHDTYISVEPFIDYVRDVRCLGVGGRFWAMERRAPGWRANVDTAAYELIPPPGPLRGWTHRAMTHLGADVLGLDFLEREDGSWVLLESNDIPGVLGWDEEVPRHIARCLRERMEQARHA